MRTYDIDNKTFVINNYSKARKMSSFLPSIAGKDGKPMWVFFANEGQCIASFGIESKEFPLLPFDSAIMAYQNIALRCFRTIIYVGNKIIQPFIDQGQSVLKIDRSKIEIIWENKSIKEKVIYSTISHHSFPGLIRRVEITNKSDVPNLYVVDGLPIFLPLGISNYVYKQLTTLSSAYCEVDMANNYPWYRYTNRGGDDSQIILKKDGSAYFSLFQDASIKYSSIVDKNIIFDNESLTEINSLNKLKNNLNKQITKNKIPSAFSYFEINLDKEKTCNFASIYGGFSSQDQFMNFVKTTKFIDIDKFIKQTEEDVENILPNINTNLPILDEYIKQSFLDNYLRGGYPTIFKGQPLYLYSRKHGDMERDYNDFVIPATYFSSGLGNFRDVAQNRRSDLLFEPRLQDFNLYLFYSLIENNGFNPLIVDTSILNDKSDDFEFATKKVLEHDFTNVKATYKEGYWIDHWVYLTDLLENYIAIYPDKLEELLNEKKYRFFDSGMRLKPRSERYVVTPQGVRQYNSLEKIDVKSNWLMDQDKPVEVNLASKIFDLIIKKYSLLDSEQIGLEMLADKPGWNDSCNGLPGLFGSSTCEVIELLRLVDLFNSLLEKTNVKIELTEASFALINDLIKLDSEGFNYWDQQSMLRERFEEKYRLDVKLIKVENFRQILAKIHKKLQKSIKKAKHYGEIIPTYFIYEVTDYQLVDGKIKVTTFNNTALPAFLESPARLLKLGKQYINNKDLNNINRSPLLDKKFHIYKTSVPLDEVSPEVGRLLSFTPGWLERESDFLHMSFKYLLGLLKAGYYTQFFKAVKNNFPCFMNPNIYGRSIFENVSFIVPSDHVDIKEHGSGHFARLTGANAEIINMYQLVLFGDHIFKCQNNKVYFDLNPHIPLVLFKNGAIQAKLFNLDVIIKNSFNRDYFAQENIEYELNGQKIEALTMDQLNDIRQLNKKGELIINIL